MGLALFVTSQALALYAATRLVRVLLPASTGLERALLVLAGVPILVLPTLIGLGFVGWLAPWPVTCAMGLWALGLGRWARGAGPDAVPDEPVAGQSDAPPSLYLAAVGATVALVAWQLVGLVERQCLHGWQPQWDDLSYHASMAAHWLQAERLVLAPYNYHSYYPGSGELFAAWFMLAPRHDAFAALSGLFWMLNGALVVAVIATRLGGGLLGALTAVALFFGCRPFMHQASSFAAVDLGGAVLTAAALAVALGVHRDEPGVQLRGRMVYVGCLAGLGIGMKVTFATVAVAVLAWMLWERRPRLREAFGMVVVFSLCALLCGGYWYLRNFVITGNPVFPAKLWVFDGPLDSTELRPTALLYHLIRIEGAELRDAIWKLLEWPKALSVLFGGAYVLAAVALLRPGYWRSPRDRRIVLCFAAGAIALVTSVAGPFSGSPNAEIVQLQVRLRFFLLFAIMGIALFAGFVGRTQRAAPLAVLAVTALISTVNAFSWLETALVLGAGAAAANAIGALPAWLKRPSSVWVAALCVLVPAATAAAVQVKIPRNDRVRQQLSAAWHSVSEVPDGSRVTWFSSGDGYKYYLGFGPHLQRVPVAVRWDGRPFMYLHEHWHENIGRWWNASPKARDRENLLRNLQAQGIDYVLIMRGQSRPWPGHLQRLTASSQVRVVKQRSTFVLLQLSKEVR